MRVILSRTDCIELSLKENFILLHNISTKFNEHPYILIKKKYNFLLLCGIEKSQYGFIPIEDPISRGVVYSSSTPYKSLKTALVHNEEVYTFRTFNQLIKFIYERI